MSSGTKTKVLTEENIEGKIIKLRAAEPDKKVDLIQFFGLELEELAELPESTIDPLTLIIPPLIRSSHPLLQSSILTSFLPFYIPLIPLSPSTHLRLALLQVLPALLEKLNDPKDRIHSTASLSVFLLGKSSSDSDIITSSSSSSSSTSQGKEKETLSQTFERYIKDILSSKLTRSKVETLKILIKLRSELGNKFGLKGWLSILVDLLEDGDGTVREQAKETVVALLSPSSTPPAARSELKKLLIARNVRKTISTDIITRVFGGAGVESGRSTPAIPSGAETPKEETISTAPAVTVGNGTDDVEIVYIASPHDLSNEFAAMIPHFEGKETEQNWLPREKSVVRIRGMLKGGVWSKYSEAFTHGLKAGIMEGLSKTIISLRTTVAQQSCFLLKEMVEHLGNGFDPFVEHFLPILAKMAGFTKKIIAERSQACMTAIIIHTNVHPRLLIGHISVGVAEKNIQTRHFSTGHLKTFIDIHGSRSRHAIEATPGSMDQLEGAIKKALSDVNPAVRDLARQAFWSFYSVWRSRAEAIMTGLDGMARKQLEKANPHDSNGIVPPAKAAVSTATTAPGPPATKRATSSLSALLAEKRKAKAAELAAGKMAQESPRIVSGPIPSSPSLQQGLTRSNSSASMSHPSNKYGPGRLERSVTSPPDSSPKNVPLPTSPGPNSSPTPRQTTKSSFGSPRDLLSNQRSTNLGQNSPSRGSPSHDSPLRQSSTFAQHSASGLRSPGSSTASSAHNLRTPQSTRRPLFREADPGLGMSSPSGMERSASHEADMGDEDWIGTPTRSLNPGQGVVEDARRAQAAQAESAARQLMEYNEDEEQAIPLVHGHGHRQGHGVPTTPARPTNGHQNGNSSAYRTPLYSHRKVWEDSPRPEAVTPLVIERLKERKHERTWWIRRQELLDEVSPLKPSAPAPSSAILPDLEALSNGTPTIRNFQKLTLFSTSHPIHGEEDRKIWEEGKLFEKVLNGLFKFIKPDQDKQLLEQSLVVLWEMVQQQWTLFDEHEQELLEMLFRLRASHNLTMLECTNALISLLTQISDPIYLLTLLKSSLDRFLLEHPSTSTPSENTESTTTDGSARFSVTGKAKESPEERIRNSGWLFGLTSLGMCVLRLPQAVVEVEGGRLGQVISNAMLSPSSMIRQSAQSLLLAIQTIIQDSIKTLSFVPDLTTGQKDLAIYYMAQNGILENNNLSSNTNTKSNQHQRETKEEDEGQNNEEEEEEIERKERMLGEMEALMGRSILRE
ncbi:uncharacterized protein IL334_002899 [Kwoniella shivajii]|uniref:TOG domain-containing protein n=1 Tax=Kwoniella shivajii TaxID=564305 RepID=A0ABZ1CW08_9TREE|nr:hypothetical protein IL334_002899 [Kwoniella shivajii]